MIIMSFIQKSDYLSEEYKGYKINVYYDYDCESPRDTCDHLGTLYSANRDYNPDGHKIDELMDDKGVVSMKFLNENYVWLPVSSYEHGGITIWCGSPSDHFDAQWDCGLFGFILVSVIEVKKEWGWKHLTAKRREKIEGILRGEIEELDAYYTGECYGIEVEDPDEETYNFDAIWGIIGKEAVKEEMEIAKLSIDNNIEIREQEKARSEHMERLISFCWAD